ncbi:hypothetical protein ACF09H_08990 [Streptomyces sp. NPDC014983]|uniref:hypothetical protein n=1 Tax=Streptomyces sp. NPDC014983 TaxID=3364933 RepID=UPI0036F9CDFD
MIATTPALLVQPDGQVDEIVLDSKDAATMCIADALEAAGPDGVPDNATTLVVDFPES